MKRRFQFRLQRLRRVREIEERMARAEWAAVERHVRAEERSWREVDTEIQRAQADVTASLGGGLRIQPTWLALAHRVIDALTATRRSRSQRVATAKGQAQRAARAWRDREGRRRALAQLEERARARHRIGLEREENARLDEIASVRAVRNRPAGNRMHPRGERDYRPEGRPTDQNTWAARGRAPQHPTVDP